MLRVCFVITFIILMMATGTVTADSIIVGDDAGANYGKIQEAIDNANEGDVILVQPGNYKENIDVSKSLTLISQSGNPEDTIVEAADSQDHVIHVSSDSVNISGFTVMGGIKNTTMYKGGIYIDEASNCIISNNIVSNNGNGIYLFYPANNNILIDNTVKSNIYNGILVSFSNYNTMNGNIVFDNPSGIAIRGSNNNIVERNDASNNEIGIRVGGDNNTLANNVVTKNENRGIVISGSGNELLNNVISSNIGNYGFGIFISSGSNGNVLLNNTIRNNNCNLYLDERVDNTTMRDNDISEELLGYDKIVERSLERIKKEMEESSADDHSSIGRKSLEFGPETFKDLRNETNVITTYGIMPSFENETERRDWLGKLMEIGKGARNETEDYFHPNGSVIWTGCGINGCVEVGILEGTDIDNSTLDEIYEIFEEQGKKVGIEEVPVVFMYDGFIVLDEEIVGESNTSSEENNNEQRSEIIPGLRIITSFFGLICVFIFAKGVSR